MAVLPIMARVPVRKPTVLVVDDDALFREAAAITLGDAGYQVLEAASPALAERHLKDEPAAVLLVDLHMEGNARLEWLSALASKYPHVRAILCTGYPSLESAVESVRLPIYAYLIKPVDADALVREVTRVQLAGRQSEGAWLKDRADTLRLTPRELEVLKSLCTGSSNREIADELRCSVRTVELHVSALLRKSGVRSRAELLASLARPVATTPA